MYEPKIPTGTLERIKDFEFQVKRNYEYILGSNPWGDNNHVWPRRNDVEIYRGERTGTINVESFVTNSNMYAIMYVNGTIWEHGGRGNIYSQLIGRLVDSKEILNTFVEHWQVDPSVELKYEWPDRLSEVSENIKEEFAIT